MLASNPCSSLNNRHTNRSLEIVASSIFADAKLEGGSSD